MATKKHFHADGARKGGSIQHGDAKAPDSGFKGYKIDGGLTTPKAKVKPVKIAKVKRDTDGLSQLA
jgi:hypothetical protein